MIERLVTIATCLIMLTGCASMHYRKTHVGKTLSGKVVVEWMEPDKFLFRPDPKRPLIFVRSDGTEIRPARMYTDGGSIPRPLRALKNYSPWGYAPAFIVHDWLFHMQDCELPGYQDYTVEEAASVMSEVMKTMMESPQFNYGDEFTVWAMYKAVQSPWAKKAWAEHTCDKAPPDEGDTWRPSIKFTVDLDK